MAKNAIKATGQAKGEANNFLSEIYDLQCKATVTWQMQMCLKVKI